MSGLSIIAAAGGFFRQPAVFYTRSRIARSLLVAGGTVD